ncbi:MAG: MoxR family ATPase [Pseudomonadota bacterium]
MTDPVSISKDTPEQARDALVAARDALNGIILGKPQQIDLAITCLLARGHLLIEDVPGVGKTTMARALAVILGLDFARIQFTSDLLPADITGLSIYQKDDGSFRFHPGPVFTQMLLADEINRATPKAQSALLEAMQERQVTIDGERRPLPEPFFVVATQNPTDQIGTFELPESQLDRFLMRVEIGYPDGDAERRLLDGENPGASLDTIKPALCAADIVALQNEVAGVTANAHLLDYLQALVAHTRNAPEFVTGLSPRASIALANASRAYALLAGRSVVYPDDLQAVFAAIAGHRLVVTSEFAHLSPADRAAHVLDAVAIP